MKKNTAALVLAILGAISGFIGGILWTACADACATVSGDASINAYMAGFIILGMGGSLVALIGGIQAFGFKKGAFILTLIGLLMQVGQLILACVAVEGFSFVLNLWTIIAIILFVVTAIFARRKSGAQ